MSLASPSRRLSVPPLDILEGRGCGILVGGGVEDEISHPLLFTSSILSSSHPFFHQGEVLSLLEKGAIELAPPSPGYYSCLFVVWKTSGSWRPVIDLTRLNCLVIQTWFKMETNQSVLCVIRRDDWMVSIDLKDAYLQILVHPDSCQFLRFVAFSVMYQFKALCFSASTAPEVFTWVMTLVSAMLHCLGIWMLRYLDDWLVLASSRTDSVWVRDVVLSLCRDLGIMVNLAKSRSGSVCDLPRNVDCDSNFEGFSLSGEGFRPADTDS